MDTIDEIKYKIRIGECCIFITKNKFEKKETLRFLNKYINKSDMKNIIKNTNLVIRVNHFDEDFYGIFSTTDSVDLYKKYKPTNKINFYTVSELIRLYKLKNTLDV